MKTEADIYQQFNRAFHLAHVYRIENAVQSGCFDIAMSRASMTLWIELKRSVKERLRVSQIKWALDRFAKGCTGDMWVVCKDDEKWNIYTATDVLRADGVLADASPAVRAATYEEMRAFFMGLFP